MSTPVTYVGSTFNVPAYQDTGYAQGTGNLSSYLIALATGSLTLSGGSFPLTADANFGGSFGLVSLYYKSRGTPLSTVGIFRMANAELIGWRNSTNGADITWSVNSSNQFAAVGADIALDAGKCIVLKSPDSSKTIRFGLDNDGNFGEM
jgi:hypothetical protein